MSQPMIYTPEQVAWHQAQADARGQTLDRWYEDRAAEEAEDAQERAEWAEFRAANQEAWAAEARHEQTQEKYQREWADVTDQYEADHYTADDCAEL